MYWRTDYVWNHYEISVWPSSSVSSRREAIGLTTDRQMWFCSTYCTCLSGRQAPFRAGVWRCDALCHLSILKMGTPSSLWYIFSCLHTVTINWMSIVALRPLALGVVSPIFLTSPDGRSDFEFPTKKGGIPIIVPMCDPNQSREEKNEKW